MDYSDRRAMAWQDIEVMALQGQNIPKIISYVGKMYGIGKKVIMECLSNLVKLKKIKIQGDEIICLKGCEFAEHKG
jgi:hypothetical protein